MSDSLSAGRAKRNNLAIFLNRAVYSIGQHWFAWGIALLFLWVGLPWLAPVFMKLGGEAPAKAIYALYSFQCHQLPQRSFFLFGRKAMYSIPEVQAVWPQGTDPMALRQFIGNPEMGYKVAWSDRMVSAYGSIPLAALLWWPLRRRIKPLSVLGFILFMVPMALDGTTHMISDFAGLGHGFRYTNAWLANLTNHAFPASFYAGNALGSFNSWMRLITGTLFGFGLAWFTFPYLAASFQSQGDRIESKFDRAGVQLS